MAFEDVYLVSEKLSLTSQAELDELQTWLGTALPLGYREYMTTLGVGTYCDLVQVLPPAEVQSERDERREFLREYYLQFWARSQRHLTLDEALAGVYFANTCDGDQIYFLPAQGSMVALPRHNDVVYWLDAGLKDPLDWRSPQRPSHINRPPFRYFEPGGMNRWIIEFFTAEAHDMRSLAEQLRARWARQEVRAIIEAESVLLFPRAIRGRIQLTSGTEDPRVGIRIDYDRDSSAEIELLTAELQAMGFFEAWRHPDRN